MRIVFGLLACLFTPLALASDEIRFGSTLLLSVGESEAIVKPLVCRYANQLQLKVEEQEAHIEAIRVYYKDGSSKNLKVNRTLGKDQRSGWIKLERRKCINKIRIEGYAKRKVAEVKVYGRRD